VRQVVCYALCVMWIKDKMVIGGSEQPESQLDTFTLMKQLVISFCLVVAGIPSLSAQSDETLIREARKRSNAAIAAHDTTALKAEWTADYHIVSSRNSEAGGASANAYWFQKEFTAKPGLVYVRTTGHIDINTKWNMAGETGRWEGHWKEADGEVTIGGTYYAKWHKLNGAWKIRAEIFTPLYCSGAGVCDQKPF
jgi:ketosteroid isomerase-like protein